MLHSHSVPAPVTLARHVECVWSLTGSTEEGRVPILPDVAGADLAVRLGGLDASVAWMVFAASR